MRKKTNNFKATKISQNILRGLGITSTGMLALLGILAISPITSKANAANGWEENLLNYELTPAAVTLTMDSGTNGVIRAGNTDGNTSVIKRTANLSIGTTSGYTVYMRASNTSLTGKDAANNIPSITSNSTLAQMLDKWGWYGELGDATADCNPSGTFKQVPTSNTTIGTGGATTSTINKKITMCFGTRISGNKAADTYSNTVTVSVVAEPGQSSTRTFGGITTMQEMTPTICSNAAINDTSYLRDTRDNNYYWVTKLLDGNCWMSQNLALDLSTSTALTSATSNVTSNWTPPRATTGSVTTGSTTQTETYSWNLGRYIIKNPTAYEACARNNTGLSACSDQFEPVGDRTASTNPNFYQKNGATYTATEYDAHYLAGNYYQWNAATAGTGGSITNADASGSICPKNWKLPSSGNNTTKGTFGFLLTQYGVASSLSGTSGVNQNTYNIAKSPLFFVRSGVWAGYGYPLLYVGQQGNYWSSRADPSLVEYAYYLSFDANSVDPSNHFSRYIGRSLRCLVQTP